MRLNPPTKNVFYISVGLVFMGLVGQLGVVAAVAEYAFWLALAGYALLVAGNIMKGV